MLEVAAVAALVSMLFVPPDGDYLGYFDWETLGCLFCVLAVARALRRIGAFERAAKAVIDHITRIRALVFAIVGVTAVFSMAFTNDVALIIMLPLATTVLVRLGKLRLVPGVFAMQALAANLCGMITPFGSPQNLYLYSRYQLGLGEFLWTMGLPFLLSVAGIVIATLVITRDRGEGDDEAERSPGQEMEASEGGEAPSGSSLGFDSRRATLYGLLFIVTLLAVFRILPFWVAVVVVALVIAASDARALREMDYALLGTFVCFFVFAGNMSRIPALGDALGPLMDQWGLLVSALTSQVISNVPAAVILSHFTEAWQPLLVGVNVGGAGTFVGSLASLIVIRYFMQAKRTYPPMQAPDAPRMREFLVRFGIINMAFFIGLLVVCQLTMVVG